MGERYSKVNKDLENVKSSKDLEKVLRTNMKQDDNWVSDLKRRTETELSSRKEYENYVKQAKKRGAGVVATESEYHQIQGRMRQKRRDDSSETTRTKSISKSLSASGLTEKEINRLKGKK